MWAGYGGPNGTIYMSLCLDKERRNILEKGWRSEGLWTWAGWTRSRPLNSNANFLRSPLSPYPSPFPSLPPASSLPPFSPTHILVVSRSLLPVATGGREDRDLSPRLPSAGSFQRWVCLLTAGERV